MSGLGFGIETLVSTVISTVFPNFINDLGKTVIKPLLNKFWPDAPQMSEEEYKKYIDWRKILKRAVTYFIIAAVTIFLVHVVFKRLLGLKM
jgi:hypothetical protein